MSDGDIFRQVDEAVRRDQLKTYWDKYGIFVLIGAVLIVAGVAGYKGWVYWRAEQASKAGTRFAGALESIQQGKQQEAQTVLQELVADGPSGYRILARFQLAAAMAEKGDRDGAVKAYEALAADSSLGQVLQDCARVSAASLRVDQASAAEMNDRVGALARSTSPWRHSARELLGITAYRTGNIEEAEKRFGEALSDPTAPQGVRRRSEMMLALIVKADAGSPK